MSVTSEGQEMFTCTPRTVRYWRKMSSSCNSYEDGLSFLHRLDLERLKLLIEDLTQVHDYNFVDLLPQVRTEDLNQRDLEGRNLAVHENTR